MLTWTRMPGIGPVAGHDNGGCGYGHFGTVCIFGCVVVNRRLGVSEVGMVMAGNFVDGCGGSRRGGVWWRGRGCQEGFLLCDDASAVRRT
ncbi:proline-rich receptor-like protein kinase PERK2 [Iris pallida]|uniref:Proline-rich receptor-like protein kinase PERK2 n=1 Tax=Iris pallida TaxID=29817 RepID=A0AAX6DW23_IRIPA|nr:proline-rich receptor-like protein kinase PERK2 [Iris pallida]